MRIACLLMLLCAVPVVAGAQGSVTCTTTEDSQATLMAAVAAVQVAGGGRIEIHGRCYHSGTITVSGSGVHIVGDGAGASALVTTSTALDQVVFQGTSHSDISMISLQSAVTRTGGYTLRFNGSIYSDNHGLFIANSGGHGVLFNGTGGGTKLRDSEIHVPGAFNAVTFIGGNDRWLEKLWIQGDRTPGGSCLVFHSTGGADSVNDTECVLFGDYGVKIVPGDGEMVLWTYFSNVYADQNGLGGWYVNATGTGQIWGLTCVSCWAGTNGLTLATTNGFTIGTGVDAASFYDLRSVNNGGHGVLIDGASHVSIVGGYVSGNSQAAAGTKDGISLNNAEGARVSGVDTVSFGAPRHRYSLAVNGASDDLQIIGNDFRGAVVGAILNGPGLSPSRVLTNNLPAAAAAGQDSRMLFGASAYDETTNRLGIGTKAPEQPLHVYGGVADDVAVGIGPNPDGSAGGGSALNVGYAGTSYGRGAGFLNVRPDPGATAPNPSLRFATSNVIRMVIDNEGFVGLGVTNPAHPLELASGAHVTAGGIWTNASSRELKQDISGLSAGEAAEVLAGLSPVKFAYRAAPTERHVGFIAEDVPALLATADRKGLSALDIVAVLTKVVQEQQRAIASLESRCAE